MRTLHFYVLRELAGPTLISAFFLTALLLLVRLFDLADLLLEAGVPGPLLLRLIGIVVVTVTSLTLPMAVLLGTIIGVGRLTSENEILAMRVAGVSMVRVFWPAIFVSALLAVGLMAVNQYIIPRQLAEVDQLQYQIRYDLLTNLEPGRIYTDLGTGGTDVTLSFEERAVVPKAGGTASRLGGEALKMQGVSMRLRVQPTQVLGGEEPSVENPSAEEPAQRDFLIFSDSGRIVGDPESQALLVTLEDGILLPVGGETGVDGNATTMTFRELRHSLTGEDRELGKIGRLTPREMAYDELRVHLREYPDHVMYHEDGAVYRVWREYFRARTEFFQRFTLPVACVAFLLLAVPLAMEVGAQAKSVALMLALGCVGIYYALFILGTSIGEAGFYGNTRASWILAGAALMMPNVVVGLLGVALFWRAQRR